MEHKTLTNLFSEKLFNIPDYQRGYAWEKKQWKDFVEDIDALISDDEVIKHHYTGTVVTYSDEKISPKTYGAIEKLKPVDVVDGQQRLTTSCLYLSVIIRTLINRGHEDYEEAIKKFLYAGTTTRLIPNNDANDLFLDLLKTGTPNTQETSTHKKRLTSACKYFEKYVAPKDDNELKALYKAITSKLVFTFYTIEEECEIGMTFELMNSRGKDLSVLELLKNYLMHWVFRNIPEAERQCMTSLINKNWKDTYTNIGMSKGGEDQCLRAAWTLFCNHSPKAWQGYEGFKSDDYFPLRNFSDQRTQVEVKQDLRKFTEVLAVVSAHYSIITNPADSKMISLNEKLWLGKIHNTGNIANFLPVMIAARIQREKKRIDESEYIDLLRSLECYAFRVFLFEGKRSNAGQTDLYKQGRELFEDRRAIKDVIESVYALVRYYATEDSFKEKVGQPFLWYKRKHLLKYSLFEYEMHLLSGKQVPHLRWKDLSDSTIEHILPQTLEDGSHWKEVWNDDDRDKYLHDIGNLVLTKDNSSYQNFEFKRKKGKVGVDPSYANSNIKQEREIAIHDDWTPEELIKRRNNLETWMLQRWQTQHVGVASPEEDD